MQRLVACLLALGASVAAAEGWPERPVRIVVPAPAASSLDVVARTLAEKLKDAWKQPVVVENKAGAGGMLGVDVAAKAAPDGHTLALGFNGPIAFGPRLYTRMPYDPARDLAPIVLATSQPNVLAVPAAVPAASLAEFVAWARKQRAVSYASVGNGSSSHLTMELLKIAAGFDAVHVPYAGSPPAAASLVAGETQALFAVAPALLPLVQAGRIKLLAVTSAERVPQLADLPTVTEQGYPGFEALAWNGLFTAAATPGAIVERINADVNRVLQLPDVRDAFARQGLIAGGGSAARFKTMIDNDAAKWGAIIDTLGIKLE